MDMGNLANLLAFLQTQGYAIMLVVMILEGPIITFVASFASSLGVFNIYIVFILSLIGDIIGDFAYYLIGKIGRKLALSKYLINFTMKKGIAKKIERGVNNHLCKTMAFVKLTPGLPVPGLILIGAANASIKKFMLYSLIISFIHSVVLVVAGYYFGEAYSSLIKYIGFSTMLIPILFIAFIGVWIGYRKLSALLSKEIQEGKIG